MTTFAGMSIDLVYSVIGCLLCFAFWWWYFDKLSNRENSKSAPAKVCDSCGTELPTIARFCRWCGKRCGAIKIEFKFDDRRNLESLAAVAATMQSYRERTSSPAPPPESEQKTQQRINAEMKRIAQLPRKGGLDASDVALVQHYFPHPPAHMPWAAMADAINCISLKSSGETICVKDRKIIAPDLLGAYVPVNSVPWKNWHFTESEASDI